jgi:hypothetical protein
MGMLTLSLLLDVSLARQVEGEFVLSSSEQESGSEQDMYRAEREYSVGKVTTTPVLLKYAYM